MGADPHRVRERQLEAASGYLDLGMATHALSALDAIPRPDAEGFDFHLLRGEGLRMTDQFEAAVEAYTEALSQKPDNLSVLLGLGWCFKRSNELPRAIAAMEDAYRAHPKAPIVLYNLACYHSLDGNKAQALSWLGRALRMESSLQKLIADETDFDPIRNDAGFQFLAGMTTTMGP